MTRIVSASLVFVATLLILSAPALAHCRSCRPTRTVTISNADGSVTTVTIQKPILFPLLRGDKITVATKPAAK